SLKLNNRMSLSDPAYFVFLFPVFVLHYVLAKGTPRRILLLAASYFFYIELAKIYLVVLFFATCITYFGARLLRSPLAEKRGSLLFWPIVALLISPLLLFKYLVIFLPVPFQGGLAELAFPIGISFFTFA